MKKAIFLFAATATFASACAELEFDAALVERRADGVRVDYEGSMVGRITGQSNFEVTSVDGTVTCIGQTDPEATGSYSCTDGTSATIIFSTEMVGKMNGFVTSTVPETGSVAAFGWGDRADLEFLATQLSQ